VGFKHYERKDKGDEDVREVRQDNVQHLVLLSEVPAFPLRLVCFKLVGPTALPGLQERQESGEGPGLSGGRARMGPFDRRGTPEGAG
jgi:hypothetical protein